MSVAITPKPVGLLMCQISPYTKILETRVASCIKPKAEEENYEVILEDTILFPEGGGQPNDYGTINGVEILKVFRTGLSAVHVSPKKFEIGDKVKVELDFKRRWDHMQQHSGQHLISAIFDTYKLDTVSWELGKSKSYVELKMLDKNTKVDEKLLLEVERRCNEAIMKGTPVTVKTVEFSEENRPESLPKDYVGGFIRNVIIDSIDDNPCCGTHVKSLSDLLCVKLGIHENVRGGNIKVPFYVGQRVIDAFHFSLGNEKKLSILLSDAPERHPDAVTRLNKQQREMNKTIRNILKDFAMSTAQGMIQKLTSGNSDNGDASTIISHHYENGNLDYVHVIASELDRYIKGNGDATQRPFCVVVSAGSTNDGGPVFIVGNQDSLVKKCADVAAEMVSGLKGGGRGCKWQGKSSSWKGLDKLHAALEKLG